MMGDSWLIWFACMCVTHIVAYYMGKGDGASHEPDEDAWADVKRYEIYKQYEHLKWLEERKNNYDA